MSLKSCEQLPNALASRRLTANHIINVISNLEQTDNLGWTDVYARIYNQTAKVQSPERAPSTFPALIKILFR